MTITLLLCSLNTSAQTGYASIGKDEGKGPIVIWRVQVGDINNHSLKGISVKVEKNKKFISSIKTDKDGFAIIIFYEFEARADYYLVVAHNDNSYDIWGKLVNIGSSDDNRIVDNYPSASEIASVIKKGKAFNPEVINWPQLKAGIFNYEAVLSDK